MTASAAVAAPPDIDPVTLDRVSRLIMQSAGIVLAANKGSMVRARLAKRLAATGHDDIGRYLDFAERADNAAERAELISVMTTNVTHFFRESHHFDRLAALASTARREGRSLKLWSAGCSSGPEPYSIAMTLAEAGMAAPEARILATDIDHHILARARAGQYPLRETQGIPAAMRDRYASVAGDTVRMGAAVRSMIDFKPLNLTRDWPFRTRFDAIFCRNVAIYFDAPTQQRLWSRMIAVLKPGGHLFVGHSERLTDDLLGQVEYLGQTSYRRTADQPEGGTRA